MFRCNSNGHGRLSRKAATPQRIWPARGSHPVPALATFSLVRRGIDSRDVVIQLGYDPCRLHSLSRLFTMDQRRDN
jgi:hypothetical protein